MSTISTLITAAMVIFNLTTGLTYDAQTCPPQQQWQWYHDHGIWACGVEQ